MTKALEDVIAERLRQREVKGWDDNHDNIYSFGELADAAICYITGKIDTWPWDEIWWKSSDKRRNLVKAAALLLAEIERLDRNVIQSSN